ncbi:hypothetical protein WB334_25680, partial [Escherichia coli]|uniref:hypothetical protein n=1 Tax=Escherichia coli TaxID=562 RepID=UPI0021589873
NKPSSKVSWQKGNVNPQDSPIVILRDLLPFDGIVITPEFRQTGGEKSVNFSVSCKFSGLCPSQQAELGRLDNIFLRFNPATGVTAAEPMLLDDTDIRSVGRMDATLTWTMTDDTETKSVQQTRHRVYTLISAATLPWSAAPEDESRWL